MSETLHPVAIPLVGKMAFRALHTSDIKSAFNDRSLAPVYFLPEKMYEESVGPGYEKFNVSDYAHINQDQMIQNLRMLREFMEPTETIELIFRKRIASSFWIGEQPTHKVLFKNLLFDLIRRARFLSPLICGLEKRMVGKITTHQDVLLQDEIELALVSGVGNATFPNDGLFAREAKALGIPVIANIINYDNILSRGMPGLFTPDKVTVWSRKMADDAVRLLKIPANKIEVIGPVVFDRYFQPLKIDRQAFLTRRDLDPSLPTVFYGGHVLATTYFDFLGIFAHLRENGVLKNTNLIVRIYPHPKVSDWVGMRHFRQILSVFPNVYFSDPFKNSADTFSLLTGEQFDTSEDELHGILRYSDVMINYFSTLGLEAAICDLPTIHIGYDGFMYGIDPSSSIERAVKFSHNMDPLRIRASRIARSEEDLENALLCYLADKTCDSDSRKEYALAECEYLDGHSSERLSEILLSFIEK